MPKIGYLGPAGSYSELAADVFRPSCEKVAYPSFRILLSALEKGECSLIVLPVENSLNGGINQNLDLLQAAENIYAFEERAVKIDHRLAVLKGAKKSGIRRIYSHQQALEQCGEYVFENFPGAKLIATPSTSASLEMIKTSEDAAIVGAHIKNPTFELSDGNIADEKNNETRFLLVKRGTPDIFSRCKKIFFSATCRHEAGELCRLLSVLGEGGLNMTKIQSRPIKERIGEYRFFIEVEADMSNAEAKKTLESFIGRANSFKCLGIY